MQFTGQLRKVGDLAAEGYNDSTIAKRLNISPGTVKVYMSRIRDIMDLPEDAEMVKRVEFIRNWHRFGALNSQSQGAN